MRSLAFGMSQVPQTMWNGSVFTASLGGIAAKYLKAQATLARKGGFGLFIVIPRQYLTTTGQIGDHWDVNAGKRAIDGYRVAMTPAEWASFIADGTILGMNVGDDYGDAGSWGGHIVTQDEVDGVGSYARQQLGNDLPLGIRVPAAWLGTHVFDWLDYCWAQGRTKMWEKIGFEAWYDRQAADAKARGLKIVGGVNATNSVLAGLYDPMTAAQLQQFLGYLIPHAGYSAVVSWKYGKEFNETTRHAAWLHLSTQAKQQQAKR